MDSTKDRKKEIGKEEKVDEGRCVVCKAWNIYYLPLLRKGLWTHFKS